MVNYFLSNWLSLAIYSLFMSESINIKPPHSAYSWYMGGQFAWFVGMGIQLIAFQSVGTLLLGFSPSELGIAQSCILFPALIFMLPAGVAAERNDARLLLLLLQLAAAFPPLALALVVINGSIDFTGLIIYALLSGTLGAFTMPVRDSLISHIVTPSEVQRAVTLATSLQFAGNMVGVAIVGLSGFINLGWVIILQSIMLLFSSFASFRLPKNMSPNQVPAHLEDNLMERRREQILNGLLYAFNDKKIAPVLVMMFTISVFYMGTFFVFFPLLVREYYEGGTSDLAIINGLFWAGMMFSSMVLMKLGHIKHLGKLIVGATLTGMLVLFLLSLPGPYLWVFILCFIWGCGGGVFISTSRTIIQARAPDNYRGRLLSVYQLSFMGGMPIGALLFGFLVDLTPNLHHAPFVPLIGTTIVLCFTCFFSEILSIKLNSDGKIYDDKD